MHPYFVQVELTHFAYGTRCVTSLWQAGEAGIGYYPGLGFEAETGPLHFAVLADS